jgi:predicted GH43/DUF377 family glycosyl hydrolase
MCRIQYKLTFLEVLLLLIARCVTNSYSYHPEWAILSGENPSIVLARAAVPLLSPVYAWEEGLTPL